jgi:hypothetical protein
VVNVSSTTPDPSDLAVRETREKGGDNDHGEDRIEKWNVRSMGETWSTRGRDGEREKEERGTQT